MVDLNSLTADMGIINYVIIILGSLLGGYILAASSKYKENTSLSLANTIFLLPAIVAIVILMVNDSVGVGIAVAGAFSLVRFRSAPGTAKEIGILFLAMAFGLIMGMGCLVYAYIFLIILIIANLTYVSLSKNSEKTLRITIPEDLDYKDVFKEIFDKYLDGYNLVSVKTTNMGSLFKLIYNINLKDEDKEKDLINELRVKNGNLEISSSIKSQDLL